MELSAPFEWKRTMGPPAGTIRGAFEISLSDPQIMYTVTDTSGVYRSDDGGGSWRNVSPADNPRGCEGRSVAVHPHDSDVVIVGLHGGIYTTNDGGISWIQTLDIRDFPFRKTALGLDDSDAMGAMAFSLSNPNIAWAGSYRGLLFKSTDSGSTWKQMDKGVATDFMISKIIIHPENPDIVYAASGYWDVDTPGRDNNNRDTGGRGNGIFKTTDGGESWKAINQNLPVWEFSTTGQKYITVNDMEMHPLDPDVLLAAVWVPDYMSETNPLRISRNGGETWIEFPDEGGERLWGKVDSIGIDPVNPEIIYAGQGINKLMKTVDGGKSWRAISGSALFTANFLNDIVIHPVKTSTMFGPCYYKGIIRSDDGGETWYRSANGLNISHSYYIEVDPDDPDIIYSASLESTLFQSLDGGKTWRDAREFQSGYVYGLSIPPLEPETVYMSAGTYLLYTATPDGVSASRDRGKTWEYRNTGLGDFIKFEDGKMGVLPNHSRKPLAVFYDTAPASRTMPDLMGPESSIWLPVERGQNYTFSFSYKGKVDAVQILELSDSGGFREHAEKDFEASFDSYRNGTLDFHVDMDVRAVAIGLRITRSPFPMTDDIPLVYFDRVSLKKALDSKELLLDGDFSGPVHHFSSHDQTTINRNVYCLACDPSDPNVLYAGTEEGVLYKTENGGEIWECISEGYTFDVIQTIAVNPLNGMVFAGTNSKFREGGAVFRSRDGLNWEQLAREREVWVEQSKEMASPRYCYTIAFDSSNPELVYSADFREPLIFRSENNGTSWQTVLDLRDMLDESIQNEDSSINYSLFSGISSLLPLPDSETVLAGAVGKRGGLYISQNRGLIFRPLCPQFNFVTIHAMAMNKNEEGTVYAAPWGGGLYKTADSAQNWRRLNAPTESVSVILIDPENSQHIVIGDRNAPALYSSVDGGESFSLLAALDEEKFYRVSTAVFYNSRLYFSVFNRADSKIALYTDALCSGTSFVLEEGEAVPLAGYMKRAAIAFSASEAGLYAVSHIYGVYRLNGKVFEPEGADLPQVGFNGMLAGESDGFYLFGSCDIDIKGKSQGQKDLCHLFAEKDGIFTEVLEQKPSGSNIKCLAAHPSKTGWLYAGTDEGVFFSKDGGAVWTDCSDGLGLKNVLCLNVGENLIYAGTAGGSVIRGTIERNGNVTWSYTGGPFPAIANIRLAVNPSNPGVIFASSYPGGVYRSFDGGKSWVESNFGLPSAFVEDPLREGYYNFAESPMLPSHVYLSIFGAGLYVSRDAGNVWIPVYPDDLSMSLKKITAVCIDTEGVLIIGTIDGVYRSQDGGKNWQDMSANLITREIASLALGKDGSVFAGTRGAGVFCLLPGKSEWLQSSRLLTMPRACWMKVDPRKPQTIYAAFNPAGMYKTNDGGASWREINIGLDNTVVYPVEINPENPNELFIGTGYQRDPRTKSGGGGGIYHTLDGGEHWTSILGNLPYDIVVNDIVLDPLDRNVLYIGTESPDNSYFSGIYASGDRGQTWYPINNNGIEMFPVYSLKFSGNGSVLYAGTAGGGVWRGERK